MRPLPRSVLAAVFHPIARPLLLVFPWLLFAGEPVVPAAPALPSLPKPAAPARLPGVFRKAAPTTITDLRNIETRVKGVVAQVSPAVVAVALRSAGNSGAITHGSAVVVSADGLVLSAAHVAGAPGRDVTFTFPDGRTARGKTLGTDHGMDAGLMRITDAGPWPFAPLGELADARLGDWVVALGHPGGFDAQRPVVARLGRVIMMTARSMQTDCTLLGGDSGGPLFDLSGRVIGIHTSISATAEDNFHVPITTFAETWTRLAGSENWGTRPANIIGRGRGGPSATASAVPGGIRIDSVSPTGRAQRVQLQAGDLVLAFNGRPVTTPAEFLAQLAATEEKLTVTIKRGDRQMELEYTPNSGRAGQGGAAP
jgi:serine protease Do